jgi:hypothetical protein
MASNSTARSTPDHVGSPGRDGVTFAIAYVVVRGLHLGCSQLPGAATENFFALCCDSFLPSWWVARCSSRLAS